MTAARLSRAARSFVLYSFLLLGCFLVVLPLAYALVSSLKPNAQIFTIPIQWIPSRIDLSNYVKPFQYYPFFRYFFNSMLVSLTVTGGNLFLCSLAAYSIAKLRFRGSKLIFLLMLGTLMLPLQTTFLPLYLIVRTFRWLNSYRALILPCIVDAFSVFLFRQYIQTIPDDFLDATRIDGCNEFGTYTKVVLPLSMPALATAGIFTFLNSWQSYLWPLVTINREELKTLPLGLVSFQQDYFAEYGQLFAMSILSIVPTLLVFLLLQRKLVAGMLLSGLRS